jgi:ferritin-like metal-binding protein YciE
MAQNKFYDSRISEGTLERGAYEVDPEARAAPRESAAISRDDVRDGFAPAPFNGVSTGASDSNADAARTSVDRRRRRVLSAGTLAGDRVRNASGEDLGRIEEIMIDVASGRVAYAVLSFGGFLGLGDKLFAIPWSALQIDEAEHEFILDVDRQILENAPGFDKHNWPDMADLTFETSIHQHYGRTPYWEHDVTDAGDYVGDDRQTNRSIEYEPTVGYRAAEPVHREDDRIAGTAKVSTMNDLFLDEIRDLYDAEQQLTKALPKMAKAATSSELRNAFEEHLRQTEGHVRRLEQIFDSLGERGSGKKCTAMAGLIKEGDEVASDTDQTMVRDAGLIAAAQKVEHYEISGYGSARSHAERLGNTEAARLLEETLREEKATDEKLNNLAESSVNRQATLRV